MTTATLDLNILCAANLAASTKRYHLSGVCVEVTSTAITYVATDGNILFAYRQEREPTPDQLLGTWIIPGEVIKQLKSNKHNPCATLSRADDTHLKIENSAATALTFAPLDATFPDWRRVVPRNAKEQVEYKPRNGEGVGYDPHLLARLCKAGDLIGASKPTLTPNGNSPALVHYSNENAFGVIIPFRCGSTSPTNTPPAWVHQ